MPIKHPFVSLKDDGADATKVRPSNWNADHTGTNVHNHADTNTGGTLGPGDVGADAAGAAASAQSAAEATAAGYVTSHEGAADPHTGYLQESVVSGLGTPALTLGMITMSSGVATSTTRLSMIDSKSVSKATEPRT